MGFNVGNFIADKGKSAVDRLVDDAVGKILGGLPMSANKTASSVAESLFNIGTSYESVQALSSQKTDAIISGSSDEFFALAGKVVNRVAGADLTKLRRTAGENIHDYINRVNPATKIKSKRDDDGLTIISVI